MRNVTIALDDQLARWLRVRAAQKDQSVSRYVAALLERTMESEESYGLAMDVALRAEPQTLRESAKAKLPTRTELYDR